MKATFLINIGCTIIKHGLLSLFSVILLTGCTTPGAVLLPNDRAMYNSAVITSDEQQLLLNMVRMRFEDRPYFVSVDSITSSKSFSLSSGGSITSSPTSSTTNNRSSALGLLSTSVTTAFNSSLSYGLTPSASISDSPTISYTPLQGALFTHQMMRPVSIDDIYLLLKSGWSASILFRVLIEQLNSTERLDNVSLVTQSTPPDFRKISEIFNLLTSLRNEGMIDYIFGQITEIKGTDEASVPASPTSTALNLGGSIAPSQPNMITIPAIKSIVGVINKEYIHDPKIKKLYKLLGVTGSPRMLYMVDHQDIRLLSGQNNIFVVRQRSFMGILLFLRHAVEITPDAVQQGLIDMIKNPDGTYYDLTKITRGLLRIHVSNSRPDGLVNTKVFYRNHWFYIADNDIASKKTFALLAQIYNLLASGDTNTQRPVLTIPVGIP